MYMWCKITLFMLLLFINPHQKKKSENYQPVTGEEPSMAHLFSLSTPKGYILVL